MGCVSFGAQHKASTLHNYLVAVLEQAAVTASCPLFTEHCMQCIVSVETSPRALRLLLMCLASSSLSPVASLLPTLSLPAYATCVVNLRAFRCVYSPGKESLKVTEFRVSVSPLEHAY